MIERTLILTKHDAVQRGIVGETVKRFEQKGFRIAGMKMILPNEEQLGIHYADDLDWKLSVGKKTRKTFSDRGVEMKETDEEIGARIRGWNLAGLRGNPIVAIIFEGYHAIEAGRKIVGHTEPRQAETGTIRGDFSIDSFALADKDKRVVRNLVHASGSKKEAENEIKIWFKPDEIFDYPKKDWDVIHKL